MAKDQSLLPQSDPDEAKFERRVRLARETLTKLTKPENEELVGVLLDQVDMCSWHLRFELYSCWDWLPIYTHLLIITIPVQLYNLE